MACSSEALFRFLLLCFFLSHHLHPSTAAVDSCTGGTGTVTYKVCANLPHLSATLRYSYVPSTGALSVSFTAQPTQPGGWVAWGVNMMVPKMVGTQALLAFRRPDGSMGATTLNISAYSPVTPSPISYQVIGLTAADAGGGQMGLSAILRLPPRTKRVFQVWQAGPAVAADGVPEGHYFEDDNLNSTAVLDLSQGGIRTAGVD